MPVGKAERQGIIPADLKRDIVSQVQEKVTKDGCARATGSKAPWAREEQQGGLCPGTDGSEWARVQTLRSGKRMVQ